MLMNIKGQLDSVSLKQFGVPENFEHLFDDVYQGEDGGIYIAQANIVSVPSMHLLSKGGKAYPIRNAPEITAEIVELHKQLYTPTQAGERLKIAVGAAYHQNENARFKFLIEKQYHLAIPGIVPDDYSFEKAYEYLVFAPNFNTVCSDAISVEKGGASIKALFASGRLLVASKDCYEAIDFVPIFETTDGKTIFWVGGKELALASIVFNRLCFSHLGTFKKFTQTAVNNLIEVRNKDHFNLYHLGSTIEFVACAPFEYGFEIDVATGKVVCYSAYSCDGMNEFSRTFLFEGGEYKMSL